MKRAVIFGAGNIGRGFIGQLLSESGYRVTFVDIDAELVTALAAAGSYRLQAVFDDEVEELSIGPVTAGTARELGLSVHVIAREYTIDGLIEALIRHFTGKDIPEK